MPIKHMIPAKFKGDISQWRNWRDDVCEYMDSQRPGINAYLRAVGELRNEAITPEFAAQYANLGPSVMGASEEVYRFLKMMTEAIPQTVVKSADGENGFDSWRKLNGYYEPLIHIRKGDILMEFAKLGGRKCKDVAATRVMIGDFDKMRKEIR